jgi:hypothetical protein
MQLVVARVAAAVAVASEASLRTVLEVAKQSTEDRTTTAQVAAATATTERDSFMQGWLSRRQRSKSCGPP